VIHGSQERCTTVVQMNYTLAVQTRRKPAAKRTGASVRQSVTIPAQLAREVRRVAKERKITMSRAIVTLAERGVEAEAAARARLTAAYEEFMAEGNPAKKSEVGEDLIRAIFGEAVRNGSIKDR
jgi:RNA polymerase-interacting CarD/CdnL/TRCF family regulator